MLCVWLPLNGDLHNQGLSNLTFTNTNSSTITIDNNGKIGQCYKRAAAKSGGYIVSNTNILFDKDISICCWAKVTNTVGDTANGLVSIHSHEDNTGFALCVKQLSTTDYRISCSTGNGTNRTYHTYYGVSNIKDSWHHLALTYNNTLHEFKLWVDGICEKTQNYTNAARTDIIKIFDWSTTYSSGGYQPACSLNDVRIYNHCLSAKEVEEIAKGLVLHYKLDQGNTNLLTKYVTPGQNAPGVTATAGRTNYYGDYGIIIPASENADTYFRLFLNQQLVQGKTYTISCYVSGLLPGTYYNFPLFAQGNTSMGVLQLNHNGLCSLTFTMNSSTQNAITAPDGSTVYICFMDDAGRALASGQGQIIVSEFKLEEGNFVTTWSPSEVIPTIYDSSGYNNDGTIVGSLIAVADSARYNCSTYFDGDTACIRVPYNEINPSGIFTLNLWFYKDNLGSKNYETLFGGPSGFEMDTRSGSSTTLSLYMTSTRGGNIYSPFNFNEWIMITMVRNGTNELYYINGDLKKTIEAKSMPVGDYFIGAWQTAVKQNYKGNISDFRIYATALTAAQIKELYNTSATIDNLGNTYARELVE